MLVEGRHFGGEATKRRRNRVELHLQQALGGSCGGGRRRSVVAEVQHVVAAVDAQVDLLGLARGNHFALQRHEPRRERVLHVAQKKQQ